MTDAAFHPAAYLVPLLALLRVTQGLYFMMGTGFELTEKTGSYPLVTFSGLVTVVIAAFTLIKPFGAQGAALASILGWLAMAIVVYVLAQRRLRIPYEWPTIGLFVLLAGCCVVGGFAVQTLPLSLRLTYYLAVSLAYPVFGYLVLARSPAERERMSILLARSPFSRLRFRGST
jgi:O-antigen/teichoic acid export membrane protein